MLLRNGNIAYSAMYPLLGAKSRMKKEIKVWLFKQLIRPSMTYATLLFTGASKMLIRKLQRLQNKVPRHIAIDRYVRIRRLHELLVMEYYVEYIGKITETYNTLVNVD